VPASETATPPADLPNSLRLLEAAETINSNLESSSLAEIILTEATRLAGVTRSALLLLKGDVLVAGETYGIGDAGRARFVMPLDDPVFGRAVLTGDTVVVGEAGIARSSLGPGLEGCRSLMVVPLQSHRAAYGALALFSGEPGRFDPDERALIRTFAMQAAIALDNRRLMEEKDRMAMRDGLTGAYNRSYLEVAIERIAKEVRRNGGEVSVLFCDVDGMKDVNDTRGHQAGDELLRGLADLLQRCSRESDVVARYGGDEFVVLMPGTGAAGARQVAAKVEAALARRNETLADRLSLSASVGVHTAGAAGIDQLLREADRRMYSVKRGRRGRR
jgi:diguanylate cyclase (GGDEF)-like protein